MNNENYCDTLGDDCDSVRKLTEQLAAAEKLASDHKQAFVAQEAITAERAAEAGEYRALSIKRAATITKMQSRQDGLRTRAEAAEAVAVTGDAAWRINRVLDALDLIAFKAMSQGEGGTVGDAAMNLGRDDVNDCVNAMLALREQAMEVRSRGPAKQKGAKGTA